jgi:3-phosphoshikimate 1-carboxyvinyltransferase
MNVYLTHNPQLATRNSQLSITGSKSETNRLLLLQALYPNLKLENISNSDDSEAMTKALASNDNVIDIHHAGTAMRFLTAFLATQEGKEVVLTGSSRMQERPIGILVDALKQLGANIEYVNNYGYPPISIWGKKLSKNKVSLPANISSQYISALLLIAPKLENGLALTLEGEITSIPYIKMTLALLNEIGVDTSFEGNIIKVSHKSAIGNEQAVIESDWSSASYFYSIVALSKVGTQITLSSYKQNSLQGDSALVAIYKNLGVTTTFTNNSIILDKTTTHNPQLATQNLNNCPDIAQTIAVTCFGLGIACHLSGLHTLKIKETDRLEALKAELTKLGATITVTNDSLTLEACAIINSDIAIKTYQDHRMAMAFAPLALKTSLIIEEAEVVSKSFPTFWEDLKSIGFNVLQK